MIKYVVTTNSNLFKFNTETQDITVQPSQSLGVDWLWIAKENGMLNNLEVNAGDIILSMYPIDRRVNETSREVFIIKDEKLKDYYKRLIEFQDAQRLERCGECEPECCSYTTCG